MRGADDGDGAAEDPAPRPSWRRQKGGTWRQGEPGPGGAGIRPSTPSTSTLSLVAHLSSPGSPPSGAPCSGRASPPPGLCALIPRGRGAGSAVSLPLPLPHYPAAPP